MKLFNKSSLILLISVVSINLLCIISVSYAYFTAQIKGNETAKEMTVHAGTMTITYADTNEVSLNNAIPGDSVTKTFKVENTGTLDAKYNIKIDVNTNEFEDYSDLTYTLTKNGTQEEEKVLPYEDGYIVVQNEITSGETDNYSLKVTFKKDESNQNDNANKKVEFTIVVDSEDDIKLYEYKEPYKDNSGANRPKLYQGMIPIRFTEENTMVIADITDTENPWYDYDEHKWGNAVLIDNTNQDIVNKFYNEDGTLKVNQAITEEDILQMYVWLPRYKYQLFNINNEMVPEQMINIEFEKGVTTTGNVSCKYTNELNGTIREDCQNVINGNWYTHPAFTFGDTELPGIWIGKFEISGDLNNITILPNKISTVKENVNDMFEASISIENSLRYNLNSSNVDTHLIKNIEWGSVAYLTNSKYGRYKDSDNCISSGCEIWRNNIAENTTKASITGCVESKVQEETQYFDGDSWEDICTLDRRWNTSGINASTTGNIYGIYDMSGGSWEYIMANMVNTDGTPALGNSGFTKLPDFKYYDKYTYSTGTTSYERGHFGDATKETLDWFGDWRDLFIGSQYYLIRGGGYDRVVTSGAFAFGYQAGNALAGRSTRVALTAQDGNT